LCRKEEERYARNRQACQCSFICHYYRKEPFAKQHLKYIGSTMMMPSGLVRKLYSANQVRQGNIGVLTKS
jgi:hypothetical protein